MCTEAFAAPGRRGQRTSQLLAAALVLVAAVHPGQALAAEPPEAAPQSDETSPDAPPRAFDATPETTAHVDDGAPAIDTASADEALRQRIEQLEARLDAAEARAARAHAPKRRSPFDIGFKGYGDLQFSFHDYGLDQNRAGGSQSDRRLVFDTTRFVLEMEGPMPFDITFEAEVEFEHGGTGAAFELEYEEFGEYEQEVEMGGEVLLEELLLKKTFAEHFSVAVGRFYVAVGQLYRLHRPTAYLATTRSEAETTVIPAVWNEMGLQLQGRWEWLRATAQVVNGLDSTAFSSQRWVASGHQARFELVSATDLAFVGRVDATPAADTEFGVSAYYGGTSRNRPKPDLVRECTDPAADTVAPCGFVSAPVLILDAHGYFRRGPLRGSALILWGHLSNAAAVSSRNQRLSNALNVLRTPVADEALAAWAELGLDVAPWLRLGPQHQLEPFMRVDYYDTMFGTRDGLFDNPRFERTVITGGLAYTLAQALVLKLDFSHRRFGTSTINPENTVRLAAGFVY